MGKFSHVLGHSLQLLTENHQYPVELGRAGHEFPKVYRTSPMTFGCALKVPMMQQKMWSIKHIMGMSASDVIFRFPAILAHALDCRLRPRILFLVSIGRPFTFSKFLTAFCVSHVLFHKRLYHLSGGPWGYYESRDSRLKEHQYCRRSVHNVFNYF